MSSQSPSPCSAGALLKSLIEVASVRGDATSLLHESVVLHRVDGTTLHGRVAVADAIATRSPEASLRLLAQEGETLKVALEVAGIDGYFVITFRGRVEAGVLIEIQME